MKGGVIVFIIFKEIVFVFFAQFVPQKQIWGSSIIEKARSSFPAYLQHKGADIIKPAKSHEKVKEHRASSVEQ